MAAIHNIEIKKLLKDFKALPASLVARYLVIKYGDQHMTENLANQTIYNAIREFACRERDGMLLANDYVHVDSEIMFGVHAFAVFLEFMENVAGFSYCRPSAPWQLAFISNEITYYVVAIQRGREYQTGTLLSTFNDGGNRDYRESTRRIGILENGADLTLVPYCGIMQFCTVDDRNDYELEVFAPEDRNTIEKAWANVPCNE